jgi:hypothetical protein
MLFVIIPKVISNTPKVISNSPKEFSITPKVLEPTLSHSALMVAIANIKGSNCEH